MEGKPSPGMKPAGLFDLKYKETCAQLGQSYLKRVDLVNQLKSVDAEIATLREAAHQHVAGHRAARDQESWEAASRD